MTRLYSASKSIHKCWVKESASVPIDSLLQASATTSSRIHSLMMTWWWVILLQKQYWSETYYTVISFRQLGYSALTAPTAVALLKSVSTLSKFPGKPTFRYCSTPCVFRATISSVTLEIWISVHGIMICCPFLKYGLSTANTAFYEQVYRHIYVVCGCRLCRARALQDTVGTGVNEGSELAINSHGHFPPATPIYHHTGGNQPQLDIGIDISATSC